MNGILVIFVGALLLFTVACAGDGEESPGPPSTAPVDAVIAHVTGTGLDGQVLEFARPNDCAAIEDQEAAAGKACIRYGDSRVSETFATFVIQLYDTETVWEVSLEARADSWVVTGVEHAGE